MLLFIACPGTGQLTQTLSASIDELPHIVVPTMPAKINGKDSVTTILSSSVDKTNTSTHGRSFKVYDFPYLSQGSQYSQLDLTVHFSSGQIDLKNKAYFLIVSNNSDQNVNANSFLSSHTLNLEDDVKLAHAINTPQLYVPSQHSRKNQGISLLTTSTSTTSEQCFADAILGRNTQERCYNNLVEYTPSPTSSSPTPSVRNFYFNTHSSTQSQTTLYKKVEIDYKGKKTRFAFWVQDSSDKDCNGSSRLIDPTWKNDTKKLLDELGNHLSSTDPTKDIAIYSMLYNLIGGHIWEPTASNIVDGSTVIHVGIGIINVASDTTTTCDTLGYVTSWAPDKNVDTKYPKEPIIAPTMYLNIGLLDSIHKATAVENKELLRIKLYTTFLHEIMHIITNNKKLYTKSSSYMEKWFTEFVSVMLEAISMRRVADRIVNSAHNTGNPPRISTFYLLINYFNAMHKTLYNDEFTIAKDDLNAGLYINMFALSSYLLANYGVEIFKHIVNNRYTGQFALIEAAKKTSSYVGSTTVRNERELLLNFATALFISENLQDSKNINPYKLFLSNSNPKNYITLHTLTNKGTLCNPSDTQYFAGSYYDSAQLPNGFGTLPLVSINTSLGRYKENTPSPTIGSCTKSGDAISFVLNNSRYDSINGINHTPYTSFDDGPIKINLNKLWLNGNGPVITVPETYKDQAYNTSSDLNNNFKNRSIKNSQFSYIYLGGKLNNKKTDKEINLQFKNNADNTKSLHTILPSGTLAKLVAVSFYDK